MRLLLGSGGFGTPERRALLVDQMKRHFRGAERVLFVPYALADHDSYLDAMRERSLDAGVELEGIHCHGDPVEAVHQAEAIFIGGGNTFRLSHDADYERHADHQATQLCRPGPGAVSDQCPLL